MLYAVTLYIVLKWSQLDVAPVYFGTVLNYLYFCFRSWKCERFTLLNHIIDAGGGSRHCVMLIAPLVELNSEGHMSATCLQPKCTLIDTKNMLLCRRRYLLFVSAIFSFCHLVFFRSSRLIEWWKLWTRL